MNIVSTDTDGSNEILPSNVNAAILETLIDVSPNGEFILFFERTIIYDPLTYTEREISRIKKLDLKTLSDTLVTEFNGTITSLKISPDNEKIANAPSYSTYVCANWISNGTKIMYSEVSREAFWDGNEYRYENANITAIGPDGSDTTIIYRNGFGGSLSPIKESLLCFLRFSDIGGVKFLPSFFDLSLPMTSSADSNGDGLSDNEELRNFLNPCDPTDIIADYDNDGLTNLEKLQWGTYIRTEDCDGNGLSDSVEVKVFKTNPMKADTDNDGVSDGLEAAATGLNAFVSVLPDMVGFV